LKLLDESLSFDFILLKLPGTIVDSCESLVVERGLLDAGFALGERAEEAATLDPGDV
jgi:hypothetical protein